MALSLSSLKSVFLSNKYEQQFETLLDFVAQNLEYIGKLILLNVVGSV